MADYWTLEGLLPSCLRERERDVWSFRRSTPILEIASSNEGKTSSTWCLRSYITVTFTSVLPKSFRFQEWSELNRDNTSILFLDAHCVAPPLSYSGFSHAEGPSASAWSVKSQPCATNWQNAGRLRHISWVTGEVLWSSSQSNAQ